MGCCMNYTIKNLTRRPVSILCNSGKSYHLPPKYVYEMNGIEIENNPLIEKLKSRGILNVTPQSKPKAKAAANAKKHRSPKKKSAAKPKK